MNFDDAWRLLRNTEIKRLKIKTGKSYFKFEVGDGSISYYPKDGKGSVKTQSKERFRNFFNIYFVEGKRARNDFRNRDGTGSQGGSYSYFMTVFRFIEKTFIESYEAPLQKAIDFDNPPDRIKVETYRIVRDTALARDLKKQHEDVCQLCGETIELQNGKRYSEAHHIKPLGGAHAGPDVPQNIIVVCPNDHAKLDLGAIELSLTKIRHMESHKLAPEFVEYHNNNIFVGKS